MSYFTQPYDSVYFIAFTVFGKHSHVIESPV